jgi:signal transduction histidine kinase/ketosteroid isomerase-like protein
MQTEAEILQLYNTYWDAYLSGDFEKFASFLDDDIVIYGTAVGEIFSTKEDALNFYIATGEEMTGKAEFRNRNITVQPVGDTIVIYDQSQLYILIEGTWTYYGDARITGILEQKNNGWKLVHQHGSFPDSRTEQGQQIASEKIKEENLQLREAVRRRTVELENTNRELAIESSLERVRTVAMSMRKPDDMLDVCRMISEQLEILGVREIRNVQTAIIPEGGLGTYMNYQHFTQYREGLIEKVEIAKHPAVQELANHMQASPDAFFSRSFEGLALEEWKQYRKDEHQFPDPILEKASSVHFYFYSIGSGGLGISAYTPLRNEDITIFQRFRNVFALAYQRFRDIEQAEAQTREARIEAAMERVRARSIAMRSSEELSDVVKLLYQELDKLNASNESTDIEIGLIDENTGFAAVWAHFYQSDGTISTFDFPIGHLESTRDEFLQWKNTPIELRNTLFISTIFAGERIQNLFNCISAFPELEAAFQPMIDAGIEQWVTHNAYFSHGLLTLQGTEPYPEETLEIQKRFAKVFEQTYIRFLDLQKAEAQARESQIEAALEKVRSRTMAMQNSSELGAVAAELFAQMNQLVTNLWTCGFVLCEKDRDEDEWWLSMDGDFTRGFFLPNVGDYAHATLFEGWLKREALRTVQLEGVSLQEHYDWLMGIPVSRTIFEAMDAAGLARPDWQKLYAAYFSKGYLVLITREPCGEEEVFKRFAQVFDQTYTRFLDLEKAEAQAREAQIEASLERVRSVALGMRKAADLLDICEVLYAELEKLEFHGLRNTMINILDDSKQSFLNYDYSPDVGRSITPVRYDAQVFIENQVRKLKASDDAFVEDVIEGPNLKELIALRISQGEADDPRLHAIDVLTYYFYSIGVGAIGISSFHSLSEEQRVLLRRFRNVFEFAYRRYIDIAQAEASAREAQIETGLERVRSRTMAMQSCDELAETAAVLLHELVKLGIAPNRLYIAIIENDNTDVHFYLTNEEGGKDCSVYTAKIEDNISVHRMYDGWATHQSSITMNMEGEELTQYFKYLKEEVGVPFKNSNFPSRRVQTLAFFSQGYIGIASHEDQPDETAKLLERFAAVFNLTYTRFNDLKQAEKLAHQATMDLFRLKEEKARTELALTELKAAQAQLIQAEKMASLGELTAGIAHEIQNPLNFVNNFSDVNTELIEEMREELKLGNNNEAIAIANDIAENEQKINHHGKRADAIVKGMLQHSRSNAGKKEPTDINALADEFLRLAYHGLRAKDKSFNATMKTDFDPSVGKIDVIPQDIGRVLLNLITNAFYAVSEKQKLTFNTPYPLKGGQDYQPTVTVTTKHQHPISGGRGLEEAGGQWVTISISDNGPGIPASVLDKIFQPFFTTKPTGQGTGLGLSLSYDIVKAHGGVLKVETKEGEGTVFTIQIPFTQE